MTDYEKMRCRIELEKLKALPMALGVIFPPATNDDKKAFIEWSTSLAGWAYERQKELDNADAETEA